MIIMNIHLITIGDKMPARVRQSYDEYASAYHANAVKLVEIAPDG